jgi:membrane associated rhomboid family serine protease
VAGAILIAAPESRNLRITPYFWVLIAMVCFELATFARGRGAPGTMISMEARLLGLVLAVVLMVVLPVLAGSPGRLI